jgi:hypothetical protein
MLDKKFIRYYIQGYLNMYYSDYSFSYNPAEGSFLQHRLNNVLNYLGWRNNKSDISWLSPILSFVEAISASIFVLIRALYIFVKRLFTHQEVYEGRFFIASLILAPFRMKRILESVRPNDVSTLTIPFIKSPYKENAVDILSCISYSDILHSLLASWKTIWILYGKYRRRDPLFRSYSSLEYYLVCCFVNNTEHRNNFGFYNTYDRWAFLMCNTPKATFIQHGSLTEQLSFIKIGTPYTAYYINEKQEKIVERVLLKGKPRSVKYRSHIVFTENELLMRNDKKNVLLVCWSKRIEAEWGICELLYKDVNLYIKPHPGDKDNPAYKEMSDKYGCVIISKTGYPHVDVVVSYESTLADEYEDVDVKVIRYDLLENLNDIKKII